MPVLDCVDCGNGTWDCGDNPCGGGGGGGDWQANGTIWLPLKTGIDSRIRVFVRIDFWRQGAVLQLDDEGNPKFDFNLSLEGPFRRACVRHEPCPEGDPPDDDIA